MNTATRQILVVDDDLAILHALSARLSHMGYEVRSARDAMSALAELDDFAPNVAILDVNLPGVDGIELADKIANAGSRAVPIFLTASKDPGIRRRVARIENAGFLEKPFDSSDLIEHIERAFSDGE